MHKAECVTVRTIDVSLSVAQLSGTGGVGRIGECAALSMPLQPPIISPARSRAKAHSIHQQYFFFPRLASPIVEVLVTLPHINYLLIACKLVFFFDFVPATLTFL